MLGGNSFFLRNMKRLSIFIVRIRFNNDDSKGIGGVKWVFVKIKRTLSSGWEIVELPEVIIGK